jgi:hypothetical protein
MPLTDSVERDAIKTVKEDPRIVNAAAAPRDWQGIKSELVRQRSGTKTVIIEDVIPGVAMEFRIRYITQDERDQIKEACMEVHQGRGRRDPQLRMKSGLLIKMLVKKGVVEGPPGMPVPLTDDDFAALGSDITEELADCIDDFSKLPGETRIGFRRPREGPAS